MATFIFFVFCAFILLVSTIVSGLVLKHHYFDKWYLNWKQRGKNGVGARIHSPRE